MTSEVAQNVPESQITRLLSRAAAAARQGNRNQAHQLTSEATRLAPADVNAWLLRAQTSSSFDEQLFCLNQVLNLDPNHPVANQRVYELVRRLLNREPELAYVQETKDLYFVRNPLYLSLAVPKQRGEPEPYPVNRPAPLQSAYRWLSLAILGIIFAGVGTLIFAPIAAVWSALALRSELQSSDRKRAMLTLWLSAFLWVLAIPFTVLLAVHIFF